MLKNMSTVPHPMCMSDLVLKLFSLRSQTTPPNIRTQLVSCYIFIFLFTQCILCIDFSCEHSRQAVCHLSFN
jgi:hypothetical protein